MKISQYCLVFLVFTNCSIWYSTPRVGSMIVKDFSVNEFRGKQLCIDEVMGNKLKSQETVFFTYYVDKDKLKEAVEKSIENSRIFTDIHEKNCKWKLKILLQTLHQNEKTNANGFEVNAVIDYTFLFQDMKKRNINIESKGLAFFGTDFAAPLLRKAMEISIQENIREFFKQISKFRFNPDGTITEMKDNKPTYYDFFDSKKE